ncbi:MAG: YbaN family protein, partial [Paludibacteraceae bacterium]|nr:YbaN family protein [Paludibacteraceae bacterium]
MKRVIFISIGFISLTLGILCLFLPILPTTPFLLLSAFLFSKSSDGLYYKLINHPKLGPYIIDFQEN